LLAIANKARAIQGAGWRQAARAEWRGRPINLYPRASAETETQN
jgi:hypothetical protein